MRWRSFIASAALLTGGVLSAQQIADMNYRPAIAHPAFASGRGPVIAIDEAHNNFHTIGGRYAPFAALLESDGYRVVAHRSPFAAKSLKNVDVVVIANALDRTNVERWALPTPSAFARAEIASLHQWVETGGALMLIADHLPFAGAATDLGKAFGVQFSNGLAIDSRWADDKPDTFERGGGLQDHAIARGREASEEITSVTTFAGSAFRAGNTFTPLLVFSADSVSEETKSTTTQRNNPDAVRVPIAGWCQGAVAQIGRGRVAVFGEAAMFTAVSFGPNKIPIGMNAPVAKQNAQFALNVMHWLTGVPGLRER